MPALAPLLFAAGTAACAPDNTLIGDWVLDPPSVPNAHGSLIRFRDNCVIVAGSDAPPRAAAPAHYEIDGDAGRFWYGAQARSDTPSPDGAGLVSFLTPDRILVTWSNGYQARYLRGLGAHDPGPSQDCPPG